MLVQTIQFALAIMVAGFLLGCTLSNSAIERSVTSLARLEVKRISFIVP
jgi:hypothetical protein